MKKILLFASALAGLFFASCQRENLEPMAGGAVTFTVTTPGGIDTRTIADGENVNKVHWAVYKTNSNEEFAVAGNDGPLAQGAVDMTAKSATVEMDLLQDQYYTVIFWAQVEEAGHYEIGDLRNITAKETTVDGNDESRAAFYAVKEFNTKTQQNYEVTLYRPFAQLNLGTTNESLSPDYSGVTQSYTIDVTASKVSVYGLSSTFNTIAGAAVEGNETHTFKSATIPADFDPAEVLTVNGTDYHYVAMNYLFVPQNDKLVKVSYEIATDKGTIENTIDNVPVKANYRTNIIGNLLTSKTDFEIIVDETFVTPELDYIYVWGGEVKAVTPVVENGVNVYNIYDAAELAWIAQQVNTPVDTRAALGKTFKGEIVRLNADIELKDHNWVPIGNGSHSESYDYLFAGTFDGNGKTIRNMRVDYPYCAGLFGRVCGATIENLTIDGFDLQSDHYAGAVIGWVEQGATAVVVKNCNVRNGNILVSVSNHDNGDKAGALAGYSHYGTYEGNVVENVLITGYRDLGGIVGYANGTKIIDNSISKVVISQDLTDNYKGYTEEQAAAFVGDYAGRVGDAPTLSGNTGSVSKATFVSEGLAKLVETNESGEVEETYLVSEEDGLWAISDMINGITRAGESVKWNITLSNDINLKNEQWNPIGKAESFEGVFDGQNHTISNLKYHSEGEDYFVGLFGCLTNATVKNLTLHNVDIKLTGAGTWGHIGAVAGWAEGTSTLENITVKGLVKIEGDVEEEGSHRIGGVVGGNQGGNVTMKNVTVLADKNSYVKGNSAVAGLAGQLMINASFENCTSNINVYATKFFAGGIIGIAPTNTTFTNCVTSGNVSVLAGRAGNANDLYRVGAIAGGWDDDATSTLLLTDCSYTGTLSGSSADGKTVTGFDCAGYVGRGYSTAVGAKVSVNGTEYEYAGDGVYKVGAEYVVNTPDAMVAALGKNFDVILGCDIKIAPANMSNAYGKTGINVKNGQTINGAGHTLNIQGAGGTWDSGINTTGGLIKDIKVTGSFRGIFINHTSDYSEKVVLDNVTLDGTTYTISCDQGLYQGLEATNSTFNGWTSYAATIGEVKFTDCEFGYGAGYKFCRPYAETEFVGCNFCEGYKVDPRAAVSFENCTLNGVALTAENISALVTSTANVTLK